VAAFVNAPSRIARRRAVIDPAAPARKHIEHESFAVDVEALVTSSRFLERKLRAKAAFEMQ
jgi:hypothetical protein